jgi:hypothetical protein
MKSDTATNHIQIYKINLGHYFFGKTFKYGDGSKLRGHFRTSAELFCVQFYNFKNCYILLNYLTFAKVYGLVPSITSC